MVIEVKQVAGYELIVLVLLLLMWASYRYWKSAKSGELASEMEGDDELFEESEAIDKAESVESTPFLDVESSLYNEKPTSPITVSITGTPSEIAETSAEESSDISVFDPRKAVIWSEVLKRPYC